MKYLSNIIINQIKRMNQYFYDDDHSYLLEDQFGPQSSRKPSFSLVKSNENMQTYKTKINSQVNKNSIKNKYIDKLKQYTNKEQYSNKYEQKSSIPSLDKRQRNRMAAKQSRDRKKLYIQLMKYQQKKLEIQLNSINKQIDQTKDKINRFCSSNKTALGFATLAQLQAKLQHILGNKPTSSNNQQIAIILDSMSYRMGGTGRERMQKQAQCYQSIINLSLPPLHRYLIWSAIESKHVFKNNRNPIDCHDQFTEKLPIMIDNLQEREEKLNTIKQQICNKKQGLISSISQLLEIKDNIENMVKQLEGEINLVRDILSPQQAAKFLLFSTRNKYRKQLNFYQQQNQQQYKLSLPKKKIKKQ